MQTNYSPISQAYQRLEEVLRYSGHYRKITQILVWIALARLQSVGKLAMPLDEIVMKGEWSGATNAGLNQSAIALLLNVPQGGKGINAMNLDALEAVRRLCLDLKDAPDSAWDVLPLLTSAERRMYIAPELLIEQYAVELMVDMIGNQEGTVWVPFDASGQIAITAARKGFAVNNASILTVPDLIGHLLILIESGGPTHPRITTEITRDSIGRPITKADYVLAAPPINMSIRSGEWAQWQVGDGTRSEIYDRSEAWAVSELLKRAEKKLIILTSHNWLFSTGQERRLRRQLLGELNCTIESVTTLPAGVLASTNIPTAITTFDLKKSNNLVRMTSLLTEDRSTSLDELLNQNRNNILLDKGESKQSRSFHIREIIDAESVLLPQRLLHKTTLSSANYIPLEQICIPIRPPTPYRGIDGEYVIELGIPDLRDRKWKPIDSEEASENKMVFIRQRERPESFLEKGDIVLSVKGTLGLTGLISDFFGQGESKSRDEEWVKSVISTSCVGLRIDSVAASKGISAVYLLMYLRSEEGQDQIKSLKVGAAMPHISIQSLMRTFRIPIPNKTELLEVTKHYEKLCSFEEVIERIKSQMEEISDSRWTLRNT
jgi:type I restriction-modification system DNA methylase subunit